MVMQHGERELKNLGDGDLAEIIEGVRKAFNKRHPGIEDIPLLSIVTPAEQQEAVETSKSGLEIPIVSEELYEKTRESLAREGYSFFVIINPESIDQLKANEGTKSLFTSRVTAKKMRSNTPPQIEVAIDPERPRIEDSNNLSTSDQIFKIEQQGAILKGKLPEDVRDMISMRMPEHASILVQLGLEYEKRTGKMLFDNWYGRTDDRTVVFHARAPRVAAVGRDKSTDMLCVSEAKRDDKNNNIFAFPIVFLPRKSAAGL